MKARFVKDFLLEFERGIDPKSALGIGEKAKIKKWFDENWDPNYKWNPPPVYTINSDLSVDIFQNFTLPWNISAIPEFIKFGIIHGDFKVTNHNEIENLDWFPDKIQGDLEFFGNGVRPKLKDIQEICDVDGDIELESYEQKKARLSRQRMKERGPLRSRKSHDLRTYSTKPAEYGPKYSRGYKLYQVLKAIEAAGDKGLRNKEIRKMLKELTHGPGTYDPVEDRGWGSWYFSGPGGTGLQDKTTSPSRGVYVLSPGGKKYLEEYKDIFED